MKIIASYTREEAIQDGVLVEILKHRWGQLSGSCPIVATAAIWENISMAGIMEIWNEYVTKATTPEQKELFETKMNLEKVWVMYDGDCYTIMYPSDY